MGGADLGQRDARARGDLPGAGVDRPEPGQPGQAQHHLAVQRHAASDQPGVTALRHDPQPGPGAPGQHGGDLRGVGRADHGRRGPPEPPRPVDRVPGGRVPGQDMLRPDHGRQRPHLSVPQRRGLSGRGSRQVLSGRGLSGHGLSRRRRAWRG